MSRESKLKWDSSVQRERARALAAMPCQGLPYPTLPYPTLPYPTLTCMKKDTPNLPTKIIPTKIRWLIISGWEFHTLELRFCLSETLWNPESLNGDWSYPLFCRPGVACLRLSRSRPRYPRSRVQQSRKEYPKGHSVKKHEIRRDPISADPTCPFPIITKGGGETAAAGVPWRGSVEAGSSRGFAVGRLSYGLLHFLICACHPCAGAMLIFSSSFQF